MEIMKKVKSWTEIDAPWITEDQFSDLIIARVVFLDILDYYKIEYGPCASGEFTHRMRCPLPIHANGEERTPSCYVSETQNKFYCFGCNSGGNIIDFVRFYSGKPYYEAIRWLSAFAKITEENLESLKNMPKKEKKDPEKTVMRHVYKSGILLRSFLERHKGKKEYTKWSEWADKQFIKLDRFTDQLKDEEWETVKAFHDKLENYLKNK